MKHTLRKEILEKRDKLDSETIKEKSKKVKDKLFEKKIFDDIYKIGLYFAKENEVLTKEIIISLIEKGKRVFLPRIKGKKLEFREIKKLDELERGSFGIMEPKKGCPLINPTELDLVIMPCVAIDKYCNRIGRGAGFYDRLLAEHNNIKTVCLAYDFQVSSKIKTECHDQKIGLIITDKRVIKNIDEVEENTGFHLLNGKKLAEEILLELKEKIKKRKIKAELAVILVGNNPASEVYVRNKERKCKEVGIILKLIRFKDNVSEEEINKKIKELNRSGQVTGILVQLPLPPNFNTDNVLNNVLPEKDVDGLTRTSMKNLADGDEGLVCPTSKGIIRLLERNKISLKNKKIVLVGYGRLVGKPLALMLKNRKLRFTVCDENTQDLKPLTKRADILITATGFPYLIKKDYVKRGVVIIDAGITKLGDKIVGDVDFDKVKEKASYITPVPGGVGPMTVVMLIENVIHAYELLKKTKKN